jgi:uncharacterized YigZ family protein
MDEKRYTIAKPASSEVKIKRSIFIGHIMPAADRAAAEAAINEIKAKYSDATHNCFAYRITDDDLRYYDDGEPSGTAGKPILTMLEKYNLYQCALVVTRYYGGTKLGTGGLIRAYGECAETTILAAKPRPLITYCYFRTEYDYTFSRSINYLLEKHAGELIDPQYAERVRSSGRVPADQWEQFVQEIAQLGNGQIMLTATKSTDSAS